MESEVLNPPDRFDFPFQPYDIQHNFMTHLFEVIEKKKLGIFESPTGTGKSLSIICGAIKWLKDHNDQVRNSLRSKIEELEKEKQKVSSSSTDWLTSQAKEIELTRKINELKIQQNRILEYDKKIENLNSKKRRREFKRVLKSDGNVLDEKNVEDEDIVLEEAENEESDGSDEEKEERYKPTRILICSRTHSQLSQFVGEILKSPFAKSVRVVSLASRQSYCINPNVTRLKSNSLINERCLDMQKGLKKQNKVDAEGKAAKRQKGANCSCPYYKQSNIEELKNIALSEIRDIEDLIENGKEWRACPYYASRLAAEDAEIVLLPYNTILHKPTRDANGIDLKNDVVIIDEAHNLLEAMAQMHSSELNYNQIQQALQQLNGYKQKFNARFSASNLLSINQLIFIVAKLQQLFEKIDVARTDTFTVENFVLIAQIDNYNMFKITKFCKDSRIAQKVRGYNIKYPQDNEKSVKKGIKHFLSSIENKSQEVEEKDKQPVLSNPLLAVISFLESLTYCYNDGRIFVHHTVDNKSRLQFLLLNPSRNFEGIIKEARSVIVAGGTMKPISEFKNRLFINSGAEPSRIVEFSCGHIIPTENILPIILTQGAKNEKMLFNYEHRMSMGDGIKSVVEGLCKKVKGGIVLFFPSYSYENWVWEQIKGLSLGRQVFREPQFSGSVETVLKNYSEAVKKPSSLGALLLSVVGGKLSEGLNFSDELGRCVAVIGLPYANITAPDLKEKMSYLDKAEGSSAGKHFYEGLCMKAVNQSIGRAVRHKDDYATILLIDERYNRASTKNALPDWIKKSLRVCNFQEAFIRIEKFFELKGSKIT